MHAHFYKILVKIWRIIKEQISILLQLRELPIWYTGVPLISSKLSAKVCWPLPEKDWSHNCLLSSKHLSRAGWLHYYNQSSIALIFNGVIWSSFLMRPYISLVRSMILALKRSPTQKKKTRIPCRRHRCGAGQIPSEYQVRNILATLEC